MKAGFKSAVTAVLLTISAALVSTALAAVIPPDELIKATTERVLAAIHDSHDPQRLQQLARTEVEPKFDFERMTRLAVGRNWNKADSAQRQALEQQFRELLVRTYTDALAAGAAGSAKVRVEPVRLSPGSAEAVVHTHVSNAGDRPIAIDYRVERKEAGWRVYDVLVENVSLITNYRGSFTAQIRASGIDGLVKALAAKNRALAASGS